MGTSGHITEAAREPRRAKQCPMSRASPADEVGPHGISWFSEVVPYVAMCQTWSNYCGWASEILHHLGGTHPMIYRIKTILLMVQVSQPCKLLWIPRHRLQRLLQRSGPGARQKRGPCFCHPPISSELSLHNLD